MKPASSFASLVFIVIVAGGVALTFGMYGIAPNWGSNWLIVVAVIIAAIVAFAIKVADQWNRAIVLRLGRFHALAGRACSSLSRLSTPFPIGSTLA